VAYQIFGNVYVLKCIVQREEKIRESEHVCTENGSSITDHE